MFAVSYIKAIQEEDTLERKIITIITYQILFVVVYTLLFNE